MKPLIIAECCQNHNGDLEILKRQIHKAAESGADYVKIQAIRSSELTMRSRFENENLDEKGRLINIKRPYKEEYDRLKKLDLSLEEESWFTDECKRAGISSMITVFTFNSLIEVKELDFQAVKVASYDCASFSLLKEIVKYWDNIFISTGATFNEEIEQASNILKDKNYHFLHCTTIYPTPLNKLNLIKMEYLKNFTENVGYSDHTKVDDDGLIASKIALALGASSIERHFTVLERNQSKDGPVSINPDELTELVNFAKLKKEEKQEIVKKEYPRWKETLGYSNSKLSHEELLNRDYYRGRFASTIKGKYKFNWE